MASKKVYFNPNGDELVIKLSTYGSLFIDISRKDTKQARIYLQPDDAKEIIEELYSDLKKYETHKETHDSPAKV